MSVRRLADDSVQPEGFKFGRTLGAEAKGWIKKWFIILPAKKD